MISYILIFLYSRDSFIPEKSGVIEKQILNLPEEQWLTSIGKKPSITTMLPRQYLFSTKQF